MNIKIETFVIAVIFGCVSYAWAYDGLLFDAMTQMDERVVMDDMVGRAKEAGVHQMALFARSRKYLTENEDEVLKLRKSFPGFLVLGSPKYFLMRDDLDDDYIDHTSKGIKRHDYRFVGEILYTHGDKSHGKETRRGERYIDPMAKGSGKLLSKIKTLNVPVMTHWEVYAWKRDWPRFSKLYGSHSKQTFIIPHMAFGSPKQVETILERHPNVYMTISKKEKAKGGYSDGDKESKLGSGMLDDDEKIRPEWRNILIKYSPRLLFATDAHKEHRWVIYKNIIKVYRKLADQLPVDVASLISFKNAERLYKTKFVR